MRAPVETTHMLGTWVSRIPDPAYFAELRTATMYNTVEPELLRRNVLEFSGSAPLGDPDRGGRIGAMRSEGGRSSRCRAPQPRID